MRTHKQKTSTLEPHMTHSPAPSQAVNADLLASLLSEFSVKPAKTKPAPKPKTLAPVLTPAKALNQTRTGYLDWKPIGRALWFRTQQCQCCGTETQFVENELYILKHGKSQCIWYRAEGHEAGLTQSDLALEIHRNPEPLRVTACPQCMADNTLDKLITLVSTPQLAFDF